MLKYVRDIREGNIKKDNGRDFGDMSRVKFYCYVIADLTPSMRNSAVGRGPRLTQDNEGYYGYNEGIGAYIVQIPEKRCTWGCGRKSDRIKAFYWNRRNIN